MQNNISKFVYMDHSATTPVDPRVAEVINKTMLENWGNPSSLYSRGREAKEIVENARAEVARLISAKAENIYFTSGGTEADNLAVFGTMYQAMKGNKGNHLITSAFEHPAISKTVDYLENNGFKITRLPISSDGFVDPDTLRSAITKNTSLVSIMHVNNEIGSIQPIAEFAAICREYDIPFHTDAVQSFGKIPIKVNEMSLDMVSLSSHKIYGPKGIGALYLNPAIKISPQIHGGSQQGQVRPGTENTPGIAGLGEAARICSEEINTENDRLAVLRNKLLSLIQDGVNEEIKINGSMENRIGLNLNISFPKIEGESLLLALDSDGIAVSTGSACSSKSSKPSGVLLSIGLDEQTAQSSLRMSLGRSNDLSDIEYVSERVIYHVNRLLEFAF